MKKLITTMFLSIVFIIATIGFTASASRNVPYEEQKTEVQLAEERKLYGGITKAEFEARGENIAKSAEGVYEEFHEKYTEDQYGGMWFDDEGYLNIYLLEENKALETDGLNTKSKIREQKSLVAQNEYIKVHYGKYSLAELKEAQKEVSNFLDSIIDIVNGGWMLGAKASINRVYLQLPIEFRDSDNEQIVALRNQLEAMDIVAITYSQAMDDMPSYEDCLQTNDHSVEIDDNAVVEVSSSLTSYNIWLGSPVYTAGGDFALAYATKDLYGTVGWITAGHAVDTLEPVYYWSNGLKIGTCTHSVLTPEYDLAFIKRENHVANWIPKGAGNFSATAINNGANISNNLDFIDIGMQTCVEGWGGHIYGKILAASQEIRFKDYRAYDRILYDNPTWSGQSGGVVWTYAPRQWHKKTIVGIHNGGDISQGVAWATNVKYVAYVYGGGQLYKE